MTNLFFYGTLRHLPLLAVVIDRPVANLDATPATLAGYRVSAVAEGPFPMIAADPAARAEGILVRGLSASDIARLDFYEGSFNFDLQTARFDDGTEAQVYVPPAGHWTEDGPWSLEQWQADWADLSVRAAGEVMGYYGARDRDEVAAMFPVIRARAASELRAARSLHGKDTFHGKVEIVERQRSYAKFFAVDDLRLRHERFDGTMSDVLDRGILVAADAAIVLPYDPARDCVLLVEQVRMGPIGRGDPTQWQLEPIAGRVDPGETPEQAAEREAQEEAGVSLSRLIKIAEVYPTPGTSTEFYYIYLGLADLPETITGIGGLATEAENIRSHLLSFDDLMDRVARFDVANAPLALAAYYLSHHRDRLRSARAGDTP